MKTKKIPCISYCKNYVLLMHAAIVPVKKLVILPSTTKQRARAPHHPLRFSNMWETNP